MPDFEPDRWNDENTKPYDNCYDYACNKRTDHAPPLPPAVTSRDFSVPGWRGQGTSPLRVRRIGIVRDPDTGEVTGARPLYEVSCQGIRAGAIADGLREVGEDGECSDQCWKVAYYRRPLTATRSGDFHFARQDADGRWSHKLGQGPVERLPAGDPDDETPVPEREGIVPDYEFCGYLCCCPDVEIARLTPAGDVSEPVVCIHAGYSGFPATAPLLMTSESAWSWLVGALESEPRAEGPGRGAPMFSLLLPDGLGAVSVARSSVTFHLDRTTHVLDPSGATARRWHSLFVEVSQAKYAASSRVGAGAASNRPGRRESPSACIDLRGADLRGADLRGLDIGRADVGARISPRHTLPSEAGRRPCRGSTDSDGTDG